MTDTEGNSVPFVFDDARANIIGRDVGVGGRHLTIGIQNLDFTGILQAITASVERMRSTGERIRVDDADAPLPILNMSASAVVNLGGTPVSGTVLLQQHTVGAAGNREAPLGDFLAVGSLIDGDDDAGLSIPRFTGGVTAVAAAAASPGTAYTSLTGSSGFMHKSFTVG